MNTLPRLLAPPLLAAALCLSVLPAPAQGLLDDDGALFLPMPDHPMDLAQLDLATPLPLGQTPLPGRSPVPNVAAPPAPRAKAPATTDAPAAVAAVAPAPVVPPAAPGNIRLNFQNAPLNDVLNYLSASAGFIITQETPVTGSVTVVSQQSINAEEAVDLLNTILAEKGYVALRNGRILKIIASAEAKTRDLPVIKGSDPEQIPRKDSMVTQILPVRYVEVAKLVDNLRPLLSSKATITSNDNSNAVLLTDTQANIHRIAEIITALDTSISGISQIRVFSLRFSDARGIADVLTQLFAPTNPGNAGGGQGGGFPGFPGFPGFGGGRGQQFQQALAQAAQQGQTQSEARQAAARVIAVADETSNSVIVSAGDDAMSSVAEVIARLDTSTTDITETQIFRLQYADANELSAVITNLYADAATTPGTGNNNRGGNNNNRGGNNRGQNNGAAQSSRALAQSRVVAVADPRTNSVLVSASHDTMSQIALTVGRLDADNSRKQKVRVYTLGQADPDNVAVILRGMYSTTASSDSASQPSTQRLRTRSQNGASSNVSNALSSSGSNRSGALNR